MRFLIVLIFLLGKVTLFAQDTTSIGYIWHVTNDRINKIIIHNKEKDALLWQKMFPYKDRYYFDYYLSKQKSKEVRQLLILEDNLNYQSALLCNWSCDEDTMLIFYDKNLHLFCLLNKAYRENFSGSTIYPSELMKISIYDSTGLKSIEIIEQAGIGMLYYYKKQGDILYKSKKVDFIHQCLPYNLSYLLEGFYLFTPEFGFDNIDLEFIWILCNQYRLKHTELPFLREIYSDSYIDLKACE